MDLLSCVAFSKYQKSFDKYLRNGSTNQCQCFKNATYWSMQSNFVSDLINVLKFLSIPMYRRPSLFAVLPFAVSTIRGPKNREKPRITREKNTDLACFRLKIMVLVFEDSKFLGNVTPANSEGNLYMPNLTSKKI